MKEFVETIVKKLVNSPEEVEVTETSGESIVVFNIKVAKEETGLIIGKNGRNIKALRTIMVCIGRKADKKAIIEVVQSPRE